ncbi:MAG TPA: hypothetical protein VMV49_11120 [Candidatus Deferrimicrobium sp.]|nr:hypothetical protein [Candidatus Deferrimicrobium sp.]
MEKEVLVKIGYEALIILNALFIIVWIFLAVFPGFYALIYGTKIECLQYIFVNWWFYLFMITLMGGLLFREWMKQKQNPT